ncbi:GNAT family N-acetyltransferase [Streptomyces sp. H10-C2]|uniref:GNAT family N-acetyltransferase n=1 Tax=unclassified Streptomyces TaxID=2593676 RepID=UPI0024B92552|nr:MULTISPECIES: GNAT family N-acetyltransferase [unclassified Streptomyces]MDJ0343642.1 GNAT family N-acetyltransferase [Streptomyces sp. PH10-H1]MDJ0373110.1 GNAT family N-acetyltransferase [Streptomyces sp. H10-C2]
MANDLRRITAFQNAFARRQAVEVNEVPGGYVVLNETFARSHEHNQLHIDAAVDPATLPALAEAAMAKLNHRRITVYDDALGEGCAPALAQAGYEHSAEVVMTHTGPTPPASLAEPVDLSVLRPALTRQQRQWLPSGPEETIRQLVDRRTARLRGGDQVLFLAVRDDKGDIASWTDLYLDPAAGIAQIEDLGTADTHTRRGYADALLAGALHHAATADCTLRFLLADSEDWPLQWYHRRGFTLIGRLHVFSRF